MKKDPERQRAYIRKWYRRRKCNRESRGRIIECAYCEEVVLRKEFAEHEKLHRIESPELYAEIDKEFPDWRA